MICYVQFLQHLNVVAQNLSAVTHIVQHTVILSTKQTMKILY